MNMFNMITVFKVNGVMKQMKVLVTGITGKSGRFMLKELILNYKLFQDSKFKFFIRNTSNKDIFKDIPLEYELFKGNLNNEEDIKNFTSGGYDTLFHIMGIMTSLKLVEHAAKSGIERIVLVHTTGIYSKYKYAGEEYRRIDKECERICKEAGISLTILRPTMIYGNLKDGNLSVFIRMVDKLGLFPVVNGARYELQPVWCGDLGKAYYDVLINYSSTKDKNYVLSGKEPILLIDMFKEIQKQLGVKNIFVSVPYKIAYVGACALYFLTLKKLDCREKVQRLVEPRAYSHDEATNDFGYNPLSFADGIKFEIEEYKKQNDFGEKQ